ncbi:MAG: hypothetical protein C0519_01370 [Hyphomicrobium sp.]|nr:hypothetical protein [Hyphomicrobium sp.]PPD09553.1 MAG: hypothetical protein CTY28_01735 [Hyphomicrobium sp.]
MLENLPPSPLNVDGPLERRPPPLRDDDPLFRGTYDRLDDTSFFRENKGREFRIITPCGGDLRRAKLAPAPKGFRAVYMARCKSWDPRDAVAVCFHWPVAKTDAINRASDDTLYDLYEAAFDAQSDRGGYLGAW